MMTSPTTSSFLTLIAILSTFPVSFPEHKINWCLSSFYHCAVWYIELWSFSMQCAQVQGLMAIRVAAPGEIAGSARGSSERLTAAENEYKTTLFFYLRADITF